MKKWIFLSSIIVLAIFSTAFIYIYQAARSPYKELEQLAIHKATEEVNIVQVNEFYLYNGSETYYVIVGNDSKNQNKIVWIPESDDGEIIVKSQSDGISKEDAIAKLYEEENPKKLLGARLGMEKNLAIWELSYLDDRSKLNYYYVHFDSGKWWRKIENL